MTAIVGGGNEQEGATPPISIVGELELLFELKKPAKQLLPQPTGMTSSTAQIGNSIRRKVLECSNLNRKAIPPPTIPEDKQGLHLFYASEQSADMPGFFATWAIAVWQLPNTKITFKFQFDIEFPRFRRSELYRCILAGRKAEILRQPGKFDVDR